MAQVFLSHPSPGPAVRLAITWLSSSSSCQSPGPFGEESHGESAGESWRSESVIRKLQMEYPQPFFLVIFGYQLINTGMQIHQDHQAATKWDFTKRNISHRSLQGTKDPRVRSERQRARTLAINHPVVDNNPFWFLLRKKGA